MSLPYSPPATLMNDATLSHTTKTAASLEWHHVDADGAVLGRLATRVASLLLGKHRPDFTSRTVMPVYVVVTNTDKVALTGNKEDSKMYYRYSGYSGGLRQRSVREQRKRDSRIIIEQAVFGMLPKNSLRAKRILHLKLYTGPTHPHLPQLSQAVKAST